MDVEPSFKGDTFVLFTAPASWRDQEGGFKRRCAGGFGRALLVTD